ncbi:MAG: Crp/Fnr family transcriptional regulator [Ignavibacteriales bacterium]
MNASQAAMERIGEPLANRILCALTPATLERIAPQLEPIPLKRRAVIYASGDHADMVYFINRGMVSLMKPMQDGAAVEVGAVGREGAVCFSSVLGLREAIVESVVHVPGTALRMNAATFRREVDGDDGFRTLIRRYAAFSLSQMAQTAACNALHHLNQRCCRWLLGARDNAVADSFPITHEFLALLLGVQRPSVSIAAGALQRAGLITYEKGYVTILDREGLEGAACECYGAIRSRLEDVFST